MKKTLLKEFGIILLFVALVGIFFYRTLVSGELPVPSDSLVGLYHPYRDTLAAQYPNGVPFKNFLITDPVRQQIPWRKYAIESMRKGRLPLWDATSFSGTPLFANIQSGVFYPLNILFLLFPFKIAWTGLIISQPLLAGLFLYLYLRRKNLDRFSSFFGALSFAFSGFSIAWLTWGTLLSTWLWVPLSMTAVDAIADGRSKYTRIWASVFLFSLVSSFLAGHIQIFFYGIVFLLAYVGSLYAKNRNAKNLWLYGIVAVVSLLLTSVQWSRILQWLPNTARFILGSDMRVEGFFIPLRHLVQFLIPDFFGNPATLNYWGTWNYGEMVGYIGVIGLMFAGIGLGSRTAFWIWSVGIALLMSVTTPLSALPYQLHIPFLSSLQPTRLLVIVDFGLSVLAAYGFSRFIKGISKKALLTPLLIIGFMYILLSVSVSVFHIFGMTPEQAMIAKRNMVLPVILFIGSVGIILGAIFFHVRKGTPVAYLVTISIIMLAVFDLFRFGWKYTPFTNAVYFFPETHILSSLQRQQKPFRIIMTDDRILPPDVNTYYGIESVAGYDPVHSLRYEEFIAAMERGKPDITPPFGFDRIIVPKNIRSPLLKLLNVRYVLSFDNFADTKLRKIDVEGNTILYERTDWEPRFHLVQHAMYQKNKQSVMNILYDAGFDSGTEAVVEYPVSVLNMPFDMTESVEMISYKDDEIILDVQVSQPRLLVAGNIYDPNWKAFIDKKPVSIYRTNYLFMGIVVPSGKHSIVFGYK